MPTISIRERGVINPGPVVSFDGQEYPFTLSDPFSDAEEKRLEWYYEEHLNFPFVKGEQAREAAASVRTYGEKLFDCVFADRDAYAAYREATGEGLAQLTVEIAGSPAFQRPHWEALADPHVKSQPLSLQVNFVRRNLDPQPIKARLAPSPTVNVLLVTARPGGRQDVGYRTVARPLLETLRQAQLRVRVDILRPNTYRALVDHLEAVQEAHPDGYYHVIHFDVHGSLLTYPQYATLNRTPLSSLVGAHTYESRWGRPEIAPYAGHRAFLFLEHAEREAADPVEAGELANLLQLHNIPIAILNACQSGKQVGEQETSLGSRLMAAGVQMVLAMGYSVTVSAARLLMEEFYAQLFGGASLGAAVRAGRVQLHGDKRRRAYYNQIIELEDWQLPVVYENRPQTLRPRPFTPEEHAAYYAAEFARYPEPQTTYRFVGRDLDILEIERRLLRNRNILLLRGMGGAGKTTLLHHLGWWWQRTGFVEGVFYYGYDQRAWTRQQIMDDLGRKLWSKNDYEQLFQPQGLDVQQAMLAERLRARRYLLILDNLESVTGAELAIQHTLPPVEQAALHRFLHALAGGKTLVMLGSRGGEEWLRAGTFAENVHILGGLDPEAASELADLILHRHEAIRHRDDPDLQKLIKLLDGYPLALEVVLANLRRQTPSEVLTALTSGAPGLDTGEIDLGSADMEQRTKSILACIAYSHSNLAPAAQQLLLCLAPFTGIVDLDQLPRCTEQLKAQPALAHLAFDNWPAVLRTAQDWGLLDAHQRVRNALQPQPTLPYFLRSRLGTQPEIHAAIQTAFRQHYEGYAAALAQAAGAKEPQPRQFGLFLTGAEYENLCTALDIALAQRQSILSFDQAIDSYLEAAQEHERYIALAQKSLAHLASYPAADRQGQIGLEFIGVLDALAKRQLLLQRHTDAQQTYEQVLRLLQESGALDAAQRRTLEASVYHQLGAVSQAQRQWEDAEAHYRQSLAIKIEFNDRYSQASTYHQLGRVAQEQRQWAQAEAHYRQALAIFIEFNDRYSQARTYGQLGNMAQEQRQWAQAEAHYRQALAIMVEFNDRYEQARTYHNLGTVAQEQRQWAQAEAHYQQALAIFIGFGDRYNQAITYHQLGAVSQAQRQWAQAEAHYQQAIAIMVEFNDRYEQADTYHQLGTVAQEQRQWAQAEEHYQQALAIMVEFNDRYSQASTHHQLGRVAREQGQWAQAREHLLAALTIFREYDDEHNMLIALRSLARLWRASGDAGLPAAAAAVGGISAEEMEAWFRSVVEGETKS